MQGVSTLCRLDSKQRAIPIPVSYIRQTNYSELRTEQFSFLFQARNNVTTYGYRPVRHGL